MSLTITIRAGSSTSFTIRRQSAYESVQSSVRHTEAMGHFMSMLARQAPSTIHFPMHAVCDHVRYKSDGHLASIQLPTGSTILLQWGALHPGIDDAGLGSRRLGRSYLWGFPFHVEVTLHNESSVHTTTMSPTLWEIFPLWPFPALGCKG